MTTRTSRRRREIVLIGMILAAGVALGDRVIFKDGTIMEAVSIRFRASTQEYIVQTQQATVPIPAARVERVEVPKPPALDQAMADIRSGKYDAAIPVLEKIVQDYQGLEWDNQARDGLGMAFLGKRDFRRALAVYRELFTALPAERIPLAVRRRYWQALQGAEQYAILKRELDDAIAKAPRDVAAMAQLMRGDMYAAQGQKNDALLDYLRTVILYEKERESRPEALFKAAKLLEELRDPRAADLRKMLTSEFPNHPYARQVSAGG